MAAQGNVLTQAIYAEVYTATCEDTKLLTSTTRRLDLDMGREQKHLLNTQVFSVCVFPFFCFILGDRILRIPGWPQAHCVSDRSCTPDSSPKGKLVPYMASGQVSFLFKE